MNEWMNECFSFPCDKKRVKASLVLQTHELKEYNGKTKSKRWAVRSPIRWGWWEELSYRTTDAFSVEGDVSAVRSCLERHVGHEEVSGTKSSDAVWDVLTRRTADADLQRSFASVTHVDCNHRYTTPLRLETFNSYCIGDIKSRS